MTGVVTDVTGAVISDAGVSLVNTTTNDSYQTTTNEKGSYTFANVKPGPGYKVTISKTGFQTTTVTGIYLTVDNTRTQDVKLQNGNVAFTVEVNAISNEVTIDTTDATIGNNFDVKLVNELPVQNRDTPAALFTLQPGITLDGSTTGARDDQNNVTLDGMDVNDFATGQAFAVIAKAPVDSVQEFRGVVAGFLSDSGPGGGGQFAMVTKSGTNAFHGDLNEYNRNTDLTANSYFNKIAHVGRPALIRNQFGGAIGGPILHNKLFFFFDFNQSRIIQNGQPSRTVPLDSFRAGNVSYILNKDANGNTCTAQSRQNTTPQCIGTLPATGGTQSVQSLDPQGVGVDTAFLSFITTRYPHVNDPTGGDGINSGAYRFNAPEPDFETNYVGRLDYTINSKMKLFGRGTVTRENAIQAAIQFPGDPQTTQFIDRSRGWVVGHVWTINGRMVNNAFGGETIADLAFPNTYNPQGTSLISFATGTTTPFSSPYSSPSNAQFRVVPIPEIGDDFSWQKGSHNIQFGGTFKWITSHSNTKLDYNSYTIGLGGNIQNLNPSLRPSGIRTAGTTASVTYDSAYALMLGRVGNLVSNFNYNNAGVPLPYGTGDDRHYRYYQTQLYIADTWKVSSQMTFSYGLNYQLFSVPYEINGLETVEPYTFSQYFGTRVAQSAASTSGVSTVPLISYSLGGPVNHGPNLYKPSYKDFAPRFAFAYNPSWNRKTVINGGVGVVYDRTVINAVQYQQDQDNYLFQGTDTYPNGIAGNPVASLKNDPRVGANNSLPTVPTPPSGIKPPFTPYTSGGVPYGLAVGVFNTAIDPSLRTPYSIGFNFGVQHEFRGNYVLKASYVGRLGRSLLAYADASQLIDFTDPKSAQKMSTAFGNITTQTRAGANTANLPAQPWFENILSPGFGVSQGYPNTTSWIADNLTGLVANGDFGDTMQALASVGILPPNVGMAAQFGENGFVTNKGTSTYQGLLTSLQKNFSHGLQFDFNYTYAHSIDNVSLIANTNAVGGYGFICDVTNVLACRGNSDFDVKHYISADFTYQLPFGRGREFASTIPLWLNEIIGGWDVSGITAWHSGVAFSSGSSAFLAGFANDAPGIFNGDRAGVAPHANKNNTTGQVNLFTNQARANADFTGPVGLTFGSRNNLRGPNYVSQNLGLAKAFAITPDRVKLKLRADAYNVFNHASFSAPAQPPSQYSDITLGVFGQITGTSTTSRVMQVAARLEF